MKKRNLLIASLLLLASTVCASCDNGEVDPDPDDPDTPSREFVYKGKNIMDNLGPESGEITFQVGGGPTEFDIWNRLCNDFHAKNPGITVKQITIQDSDALYTSLINKNAPDVIQCESHNFGEWAKLGYLQAIQPLIEEENYDLSDFWPQALELYSFNTKTGIRGNTDLFALPKDFGVNGIFVNKRLLDQAKSAGRITQEEYDKVRDQVNPMTYDEYISIAHKMTVDTGDANTIYGSNRIYWESYLWSTGEDILTDKYQLNYDSENVKKVFEYSKSMLDKDSPNYCSPYTASASASSADEQTLFTSDKIVMYWSGRWNVPAYDGASMQYFCIPCPVADLGNGNKGVSTGWCSTIGYSIPFSSKKGRMAYKFIKYLSSPEAYRIMNELNYAVPGRMSLCEEDEFKNPRNTRLDSLSAQMFFNLARNARLNNASRFSNNRWITAFENKLERYFVGDYESVDEFLLDTRNDVQSALKSSDPYLFRQ